LDSSGSRELQGLECNLCGSSEVIYSRIYEGVVFCNRCFKEDIVKKVRRTISRYNMLSLNDRVAVAVSGGKDSLTLLKILVKLGKRFPQSQVVAVTVDEGIEGYRDEAIRIAEKSCGELGVRQIVLSFKRLYGIGLDELVEQKKDLTPCSYCGVLRRRALEKAAEAAGSTKIAVAHNLDDEAQTFLLNLFHGDVTKISRAEAVLIDPQGQFLPRIKPMREVPEKEIALYAYLSGIQLQTTPCPYAATALRNDIRAMLDRMEERHPGTKCTILRSAERVREGMKKSLKAIDLHRCDLCGEPTASRVCEVCRMLQSTTNY